MISQIILFKDAQDPLLGNPHTDWEAWSNAYTSMTFEVPFGLLGPVASASVQVVFTAAPGAYETGVGLLCNVVDTLAPNIDFTDAQMLAEFAANDPHGTQHPHPYRGDITEEFNNLVKAGELRYLGIASWGNGSVGPKIWNVELRLVW